MSMSMSMPFDYQANQFSSNGSNTLQPVSFDKIASSSAPTDKSTTPSVESEGNVDVDVDVRLRKVVGETAMNAGTLSARRNGDVEHPNILVVLSIAVGTVVAGVVLRKISQARTRTRTAKNVDSYLLHPTTEETV